MKNRRADVELLSEEILTLAVGHVKDTLAKVLIPIVEALGGCSTCLKSSKL